MVGESAYCLEEYWQDSDIPLAPEIDIQTWRENGQNKLKNQVKERIITTKDSSFRKCDWRTSSIMTV